MRADLVIVCFIFGNSAIFPMIVLSPCKKHAKICGCEHWIRYHCPSLSSLQITHKDPIVDILKFPSEGLHYGWVVRGQGNNIPTILNLHILHCLFGSLQVLLCRSTMSRELIETQDSGILADFCSYCAVQTPPELVLP